MMRQIGLLLHLINFTQEFILGLLCLPQKIYFNRVLRTELPTKDTCNFLSCIYFSILYRTLIMTLKQIKSLRYHLTTKQKRMNCNRKITNYCFHSLGEALHFLLCSSEPAMQPAFFLPILIFPGVLRPKYKARVSVGGMMNGVALVQPSSLISVRLFPRMR